MDEIIEAIKHYEANAEATDFIPDEPLNFGLIGLIGEIGELTTIEKKNFRGDLKFNKFNSTTQEELGDCFWYLDKICRYYKLELSKMIKPEDLNKNLNNDKDIMLDLIESYGDIAKFKEGEQKPCKEIRKIFYCLHSLSLKNGTSLKEVLEFNLDKINKRYGEVTRCDELYKQNPDLPDWQKFPEKLEVKFISINPEKSKIAIIVDGRRYGDLLTDNSHSPDGYRFHDVFHFGFFAILSWSPVTRALLKVKRKSDPETDEVEDGARAILIEEGIVHLVFRYCEEKEFEFPGNDTVDTNLLKTIHYMTTGYEADKIAMRLWEKSIIDSSRVFKKVWDNAGGTILLNRETQKICYKKTAK